MWPINLALVLGSHFNLDWSLVSFQVENIKEEARHIAEAEGDEHHKFIHLEESFGHLKPDPTNQSAPEIPQTTLHRRRNR